MAVTAAARRVSVTCTLAEQLIVVVIFVIIIIILVILLGDELKQLLALLADDGLLVPALNVMPDNPVLQSQRD